MRRYLSIIITLMVILQALCVPALAWDYANDVQFSIDVVNAAPGETVEVDLWVSSNAAFNSMALYEFTYDASVLTFSGFNNTLEMENKHAFNTPDAPAFDGEKQAIVIALSNSEALNCRVCTLKFKVADDAKDGEYAISMKSLIKQNSVVISSGVTSGKVVVAGAGSETTPSIKIENVTAAPGQTFDVNITAENFPAVVSMLVRDFTYDTDLVELVDAEWKIASDAAIANWDQSTKTGAIAFAQNKEINGIVMTLTFVAAKDIEGDITVSCTTVVNEKVENSDDVKVTHMFIPGKITISEFERGDVNGDGYVNAEDAIYLLYYTLLSDMYPINQSGDMNGDGYINADDAIYLLYYTLLPDMYPLM